MTNAPIANRRERGSQTLGNVAAHRGEVPKLWETLPYIGGKFPNFGKQCRRLGGSSQTLGNSAVHRGKLPRLRRGLGGGIYKGVI